MARCRPAHATVATRRTLRSSASRPSRWCSSRARSRRRCSTRSSASTAGTARPCGSRRKRSRCQTIVNLVSAGHRRPPWVPASLTLLQRPGVRYRPRRRRRFQPTAVRCETSLVWPTAAPPVVARFVGHVRAEQRQSACGFVRAHRLRPARSLMSVTLHFHPQFRPGSPCASGRIAIHWYGITYLVASGLFVLRARRPARLPQFADAGWTAKDVEDLLFFGVHRRRSSGGRLGYALFYKPARTTLISAGRRCFEVWKGGMSFHGGLLGVLGGDRGACAHGAAGCFLEVTDLVAPCVPIGLACGRIRQLHQRRVVGPPSAGRPVAAVGDGLPADAARSLPRHPSQLYQFGLQKALLLFALLWVYARKPQAAVRPTAGRHGASVSGAFLDRLRRLPLRRRVTSASPTASSAC